MKIQVPALVAGAFLLLAAQLLGQTSGVSHPETIEDTITVVPPPQSTTTVATTVTTTTAPTLRPRPAETLITVETKPPAESAEVITPVFTPAPVSVPHADPDAGIVASAPFLKNALVEGTLVRARLNEQLSSKTTTAGTRFTAELAADVLHDGKVVIPAGAVLTGRVTSVQPGHRMGAAASIHLEPQSITLPDGSFYEMNARVIDTGEYRNHHVNSEGTILHSEHGKATLGALGLTTASAAVAGAVVGGGAGAAVGAGIGAGVGAVWWFRRDRAETLEQGTEIIFSLDRPLALTPIKN